jgi:hypothetical protein
MLHYYLVSDNLMTAHVETHGSDDHTSNGEVCLNPRDVEDSNVADANANTVERIAVLLLSI